MLAKASQFLAVVLTALALLPGGAHLMALPAKIAMPEDPYFVAQQVYRGWAWAGVVIFLAIFANFVAAFLSARAGSRQLFTVAGLLIAATLAALLRLDLSRQPGDRQLDVRAGELGAAEDAVGILPRRQCCPHLRRAAVCGGRSAIDRLASGD